MADSVLTTEQQIESIWALGGLTSKQLARRVWAGINDTDLFGRASELAYNFLLAVFPLVLFLLSLFGLFASRGTILKGNLLFYFAQVLPPMAFQVINQTVEEVTKNSSGGKVTFGIIVSLWVASGGMNSMISTLNGAYGVRESRSLWKVRAIAVALTIAIATFVISALILVLVGGHIADFLGNELGVTYLVVKAWKIFQWPAALAFLVVSFSLIYYYGPDVKEQHWYWITPGSFFGVLVWLAASFAFRVYLHFYNSYSGTYGSLGAVIILMVWFYVTGLAFLIGGEINAQIEHAAAKRGHPEAKLDHQKAA